MTDPRLIVAGIWASGTLVAAIADVVTTPIIAGGSLITFLLYVLKATSDKRSEDAIRTLLTGQLDREREVASKLREQQAHEREAWERENAALRETLRGYLQHDVQKLAELDELGRQGRIDRRDNP